MSIGILSARSTLAEHPNCPESWLVHRAKLDINSARASGDRVYLSLDGDSDNDKQWVNDALQYQAMTRYEQVPEIIYHDQVKFNRLWDSLDGLEQKLLMILRESASVQKTCPKIPNVHRCGVFLFGSLCRFLVQHATSEESD